MLFLLACCQRKPTDKLPRIVSTLRQPKRRIRWRFNARAR